MARRVIAAVVFALVVVWFVVVHDANRSDARFTVVSGPPDPVIPTVMHGKPTRYQVVATRVTGRGHLYLQVGTYLAEPSDTVVLAVLDRRGARIARCVFPPSSYTDNGKLRCPLPDISRAGGLVVTRRGTSRIAIYAHDRKAGFLVKNEATSLGGRVSTVLSRVAVPLPAGAGSSVLLISLFGSVALTALALLLAVRPPNRRGGVAGGTGAGGTDTATYLPLDTDDPPDHPQHHGEDHQRPSGHGRPGETGEAHAPGGAHRSGDAEASPADAGGSSGDTAGGDSGGDSGGGGD